MQVVIDSRYYHASQKHTHPLTVDWKYANEIHNFQTLEKKSVFNNFFLKKGKRGTSLVLQWIEICPPMQQTWVWSLIQEDSTCLRTSKPTHAHNWTCVPQLLKSTCLEPALCNKRCCHGKQPSYPDEEYLQLAITRESPCTAMKTQHGQK